MKWYAAHIINAMRRRDGVGAITVFENVYLIKAKSDGEAQEKAKQIANSEIVADSSLEINGMPADQIRCVVRKVVSISNPDPPQYEKRPYHGSEITYLEYEIDNVKTIDHLIANEMVDIRFVE